MLDSFYDKSFDWDQMFLRDRMAAFDGRKSGIAACLARDSYYNDTRYGETLLRLGFYDAQLFCENHLQAIIGCLDIEMPDETLALIPIVFRGSDQVQDWLQNFDVRMTRFINTEQFPRLFRLKVHNGIFENVHDFEKKAESIIFKHGLLKGNLYQILRDELKKKRCFFWIIGHSLGGAMATLFAARLLDYYGVSRDRILTHTFGAPPVGNRYFAARYGHKSAYQTKVIKKRSELLTVPRVLPMTPVRKLKVVRLSRLHINYWGSNTLDRKCGFHRVFCLISIKNMKYLQAGDITALIL